MTYSTEYIKTLRSQQQPRPITESPVTEKVPVTHESNLEPPVTAASFVDHDNDSFEGLKSFDDDEDGFIPLDPEVAEEEQALADAVLHNEYDLEEAPDFQDEELALDGNQAEIQAQLRRKEMQEAIDEYESELQPVHGPQLPASKVATEADRTTISTRGGSTLAPLPTVDDGVVRLKAVRDALQQRILRLTEEAEQMGEQRDRVKQKMDEMGQRWQR